jgi:large subunit ribosomal protein L23
MNNLFLKPRLSEKAYKSSQDSNVYVFVVDKQSNKNTIKANVESQFKVIVEKVKTAYLPAKTKKSMLKGNRKSVEGVRASVKKAFVTLKKGDSIPIFAVEEAEKERQDKLAKTLSKGKK